MEQMTAILYLCVAVPMLPVIIILPEKKSRLLILYFLLGMTVCFLTGSINAYLVEITDGSNTTLTTIVAPITEELLKAVPVIYYALLFSDDRKELLSVAFMTGIGFAILENIIILTQTLSTVTVVWAAMRAAGATLMHGACTAAVGLGISFIRKRKKLFYCGTFALLSAAITFHAVFNVLVISQFSILAFILPSALYIFVIFILVSEIHFQS